MAWRRLGVRLPSGPPMRDSFLPFSIDIATRAGAIIKNNFTTGMQKQWKKDNTPVTETDIAINQMVIDEVNMSFPTHSVLAEEGSSLKKGAPYVWVCDPVDGTIPFSHGIPTCVFSLALVHHGVPVCAVVYDPFMDRMITSEKSKGAFLNGKSIHVSSSTTLQNTIVSGMLWKQGPYNINDVFIQLDDENECVPVWLASIVYSGMLVACGEIAVALYQSTYAHDIAALKLIVEESGGSVTDLFGKEQRYDGAIKGAIISNGHLHEKIVELTRRALLS